MGLLTVTVLDTNSSDTMSRTFSTLVVANFKKYVMEYEKTIPYERYTLTTPEDVEVYSDEIQTVLEELEISEE
jgi:hypothetical protein